MSSTSSSCASHAAAALGRRVADVGLLAAAVLDRAAGDPTTAGARCTTAGCSPSSRGRPRAQRSGWKRTRPVRDDLDRRPGQLVHAHEPLQRDQRLDPLARAMRVGHRVRVGLAPCERSCSRSSATTAAWASATVSPTNRSGASAVIRPSSPITLSLLEAVAAADLEVVGVVTGRDLQRACAELGLDVLVGDDLQLAPDQRQDRALADEPRVALVVGVDRDRGVGEHRLRAHGRDRDLAATDPSG